uniref:Uncharacterized protein n=1 Tax=Oryza rufipogon TaxID=4529 RepID=A0A0E0NJ64_ORYRU
MVVGVTMVVIGVLLGSSSAARSCRDMMASILHLLPRHIDAAGTTRSACRNLHGHLLTCRELRAGLADRPSSRPWSWFRFPLPLPLPPVAASAGLLAFLSDASGHKTLLLAHPITRLLAALPITPTPRLSTTVGLTAGPTSITAVVAGDDLVSPFAIKNISAVDACGHYAAAAAATEVEQAAAARGRKWRGCR